MESSSTPSEEGSNGFERFSSPERDMGGDSVDGENEVAGGIPVILPRDGGSKCNSKLKMGLTYETILLESAKRRIQELEAASRKNIEIRTYLEGRVGTLTIQLEEEKKNHQQHISASDCDLEVNKYHKLELELKGNKETLKQLQQLVDTKDEKLAEIEEQKSQLAAKVVDLEGNLRDREVDIQRLERDLALERIERGNAEANSNKLQESVAKWYREFSVFVNDKDGQVAEGSYNAQESVEIPRPVFGVPDGHVTSAQSRKNMKGELAKMKDTATPLNIQPNNTRGDKVPLKIKPGIPIPAKRKKHRVDKCFIRFQKRKTRRENRLHKNRRVSIDCLKCGVTCSSWKNLYVHNRVVHVVRKAAKNVHNRKSQKVSLLSLNNVKISKKTNMMADAHPLQEGGETVAHAVDISKPESEWHCICGKQFACKRNLKMHVKYRTTEWKFVCEECGAEHFKLSHLKRHHIKCHKMTSTLAKFKVGCTECGQMFEMLDAYHKHRKDAHGIVNGRKRRNSLPNGTRMVPVADVTTRVKEPRITFDTHGRNLRAGRNLEKVSPTLQVDSPDEDDITVLAHLAVEPYKNNKEHRVDHGRDFFCVCESEFVNKYTLAKHVKKFNSDHKFVCKTCRRTFLSTTDMKSHMKIMHKIVHNSGETIIMDMRTFHPTSSRSNIEGGCGEPGEMKYVASGNVH